MHYLLESLISPTIFWPMSLSEWVNTKGHISFTPLASYGTGKNKRFFCSLKFCQQYFDASVYCSFVCVLWKTSKGIVGNPRHYDAVTPMRNTTHSSSTVLRVSFFALFWAQLGSLFYLSVSVSGCWAPLFHTAGLWAYPQLCLCTLWTKCAVLSCSDSLYHQSKSVLNQDHFFV